MLRIKETKEQPARRIAAMKDMKPLEVGRVKDADYPLYDGNIVIRTASLDKFEVINLSNARPGGCWYCKATLKVELLPPGEVITIELFNE